MSNQQNDLLNEQREENKPMNHTPTPYERGWSGDPSAGNPEQDVFSIEKEGCTICTLHGNKAESNRNFIVTACNGWNDINALKNRLAELEAM